MLIIICLTASLILLASNIGDIQCVSLPSDAYLTNYWPIDNSQMTDVIGQAHMQQGMNTTFVADRFGIPNSALGLNGGYTVLPSGVYFSTPFTITVWVCTNAVSPYARILDIGNGFQADNIVLLPNDGAANMPYFLVSDSTTWVVLPTSSVTLVDGQWYFLAATYSGTYAQIYVDGHFTVQASTTKTFTPNNVIRTQNYVGKSVAGNGYSFTYVDDLRFYNICMTPSQLNDTMNNVYTTTTTSTTTTTLTTTHTTTTTTTTSTTTTSTTSKLLY